MLEILPNAFYFPTLVEKLKDILDCECKREHAEYSFIKTSGCYWPYTAKKEKLH